jgi:hypothetical protein
VSNALENLASFIRLLAQRAQLLATGWTTGVRLSSGAGIFLFTPQRPDRLYPMGTAVSSVGVKRLECGALPPFSQYVVMI